MYIVQLCITEYCKISGLLFGIKPILAYNESHDSANLGQLRSNYAWNIRQENRRCQKVGQLSYLYRAPEVVGD